MKRAMFTGVAALALFTGVAVAGSAQAAPATHTASATTSHVTATFEGRKIDLSKGWGAAKSCSVWGRGDVQCYRTDAAAAVANAKRLKADTVRPSAQCSTALGLYQDANEGGRHLKFFSRGYWQDLSAYDFDNALTSYWVGACGAHLAENDGGGGHWYPGNTNAGSKQNVTGDWNDRVSSIYIE